MKKALCWIRRDLRLSDHRSLFMACEAAESVAIVFVFDTCILNDLIDKDDKRVTFIYRSLLEIQSKLKSIGSDLIVRIGDPCAEIPKLAQQFGANAVFAAHDFEPYALGRDKTIKAELSKSSIDFITCKDHVIRQKTEVLNQTGLPFKVFTPYSKVWRAALDTQKDLVEYIPNLSKLIDVSAHVTEWGMDKVGFTESELWLEPGEGAARTRLEWFKTKMDEYGAHRDFPATEGTSGLSVHIRFGTISIRELVRAALEKGSPGADKWLSELIWREFYADILANTPEVVETTYNPIYRDLEWPGSDTDFELWKKGMTGYPIVDAAMRCFNETGWMHNRLRMIVASFLTKDLLVDYRKGEAYFADKLLDFELASNNGGWQWAASTGCDAQPYFRIFNPYLQSKKFDPECVFIRQWVPEIAALSNESIHEPSALECFQTGYPTPIVDHFIVRDRAIALLSTKTPISAEVN